MAITRKTCSNCNSQNPGAYVFCPICGESLAAVIAVPVPPRVAQAEFSLPEYLKADYGLRRYRSNEGGGGGFVWIGLALIIIPAISSNISPLTLGAWITGLCLIVGGFLGLRRNRRGIERAGGLMVATSLLFLTVVGTKAMDVDTRAADLLFPFNPPGEEVATEVEPGFASGEVQPVTLNGKSPMDRGSPQHLGVLPGPGPVGNPYRAWRFDTGAALLSTPAVVDGIVYFGSHDGSLRAVKLLDGEEIWRTSDGDYPITGSPAVESGLVITTRGFDLLAYDAKSGLERWRFEMAFAGAASPVIDHDVVYVASKGNFIYAVDLANGERRWYFKIDGLLFAPPTIVEDRVLIGSDNGKLYSLDTERGKVQWMTEFEGGIYSTTAVSGGVLMVVTSDQTTHAVDIDEGKPLWSTPIGGSASPALWNGMALVGSADGGVYALDIENKGTTRWLAPLGSVVAPLSPVVAEQIVYVSSGQNVYALAADSGEEVWHYPLSNTATTSPVVVDGMLLVGAKDGYLYAITGDGQAN